VGDEHVVALDFQFRLKSKREVLLILDNEYSCHRGAARRYQVDPVLNMPGARPAGRTAGK